MSIVFRRRRSTSPASIALLLLVLIGPAHATSVAERDAPFRACLDGRFETWVNAQAALVVNEDPRAGDIDDAAVAKWAVEALEACNHLTAGDKDTEALFTKRVAQWREHIDSRARSIRELTRPD